MQNDNIKNDDIKNDYIKNNNALINELYERYKNNEYMMQRLQFHLNTLLPSTLENECKNHEKRMLRNDYLVTEHQQFIQVFLSKNQYFYLPNNNSFYYYDGKNYSHVKEDIIHHQLLMTISKDKKLTQWKYRTKINVLKQIKDRHLFKSIPESNTIQNILSLLHPSIFSNKNQAKYFLSIIGDNILKKNNDLIFLIKPKGKKILLDIENISYIYSGFTNITNNIVTKYHENYNYGNCRLLKINNPNSIDMWRNLLIKYGIDFICVAVHYSQRFENSDNFIYNIVNDDELKSYTLFLKNNSQNSIVDKFCNYSIQSYEQPQPLDSNLKTKISISWKNMHYIWKLFISHFSLPSAIYLNYLKSFLKERFAFDETTDTFYNVTSKYLPCVSDFIQFWEQTINISANDNNNENDNEFEIDELCILFKKWAQENLNISGAISEDDVLKILKHFFPSIEIVDNKYLLGISCNMWDKNEDIYNSLVLLKQNYYDKSLFEENHTLIAFDEAYDFYFKKNKSMNKNIVSKKYFEKYLYSNMSNYIEYEKFISSSWYLYKNS